MAEPLSPDASRSARIKQIGITVGVMLLVGILFFFIGMLQGKKPIPELETRAMQAEARLASAQDRARLMEALALTYRTALDLDARNFGTANGHLHQAARALDGLSATDGGGVDELRRLMSETDVTVAEDLAGQRARVISYAQELSDLLEQDGAPPIAPSDSTE